MERLCAHCAVSRARHHAIALLWAVWPEWTGPGRARGPLTLRLAGTPERWIEEKQQTTEKLSFQTFLL